MSKMRKPLIGFIGQGWIGKNYDYKQKALFSEPFMFGVLFKVLLLLPPAAAKHGRYRPQGDG